MLILLSLIHYVLLGVLYWQAIDLLRTVRGNSLLAIYAIALMTQCGLFWGVYLARFEHVDMPLSEAALVRMAISMCLTSAVFITAIVILKTRLSRLPPMPIDGLKLSQITSLVIVFCGLVFAGLLITSPASRLVIQHGTDVFGSAQYYQMRGELIQVQTAEGRGRIMTRFMALTYCVLLLAAFVFVYKAVVTKKFQWLAVGGLFVAAPLAQALLSLQKTPIVMLMAGFMFIFLLFRRQEGRIRFRFKGLVVGFGAIGLLGLLSFVAFQGMRVYDAGEATFNRAFIVPINTAVAHCEVYPDYHPHVKFADVGLVRQIAIIGHVPMYGSMAREVAMTLRGQDFNANTGLIGNGWGTWGYFGVVFLAMVMAGAFFVVDRFTNKRRHLASVAPLIVYYWFFFVFYGNSNFHNLLGASSLWLLPFLYFRIFAGGGGVGVRRAAVQRPSEMTPVRQAKAIV